MTDQPHFDESQGSDGFFAQLPWWLIGPIAVIMAEMTSHPSVGIILVCLRFGWNDFRTALWLWNRDPNVHRGFVCACFYLSSGLWRVCLHSFIFIAAFVMFIGFTSMLEIQLADRLAEGDQRRVEIEFVTNAIIWLSSCAVATALTLASIALAIRSREKIWISRSISESRHRNEWPPRVTYVAVPETNLLRTWVLATALAIFMAPLLFGVWFLLSSNPGTPRDHDGLGAIMKTMSIAFLPFLGIGFVFMFEKAVYQRLGGSCVAECWPDDESFTDSNLSG